MVDPSEIEITRVLRRVQAGDAAAGAELFALVQGELRHLAGHLMRGQPAHHTLQATALVHEAWIRLLRIHPDAPVAAHRWQDRRQFLQTAARAMRSTLVDHARRRKAQKRSAHGARLPLDNVLSSYEDRSIDVIAVHEALARLERIDPELAQLVDLRFFAGLTMPETAEVLQVSTATLDRRWRTARALLHLELRGDDDEA